MIQTDPFFAQLRAWSDTLWQLWTHNMHVPGAAPILMTQATAGASDACTVPAPRLLSAEPGDGEVTLSWTDEHTANPSVAGYNLRYTRATHQEPIVTDVGLATTYTDMGLENGRRYCYKVSAYDETGCESGFKETLCAVPTAD